MNVKYKNWKKSLDIAKIEFDNFEYFVENINNVDFSCKTKYSKEFYNGRYKFFFDAEIIQLIYEKNLKSLTTKRINPYDYKEIAKKYKINDAEAKLIVENRKKKTSGTLENFIRRHGETKGKELFEQFKRKSSHTLEKYIEKYGEIEGKLKYEDYLKSKSSSFDKCVERYGETEGKLKYEDAKNRRKHSATLDGKIEKYGEVEGRLLYDKHNKRKASNLEKYIEKYGEIEGKLKYDKSRLRKSYCASIEYFIEKYGEIDGREKFELAIIKRSPIFCELKKIYTYEEALSIYKNANSKKYEEAKNKVTSKLKSIYHRRSSGCVSKESLMFFKNLECLLGLDLEYGNKSTEKKLFDEENKRIYYYDCFCPSLNLIIEFHGKAYHPMENEFDWVNPFGETYELIRSRDIAKKECALKNGYRYIEVWSGVPFIKNLEKIKKEINGY